MRSSCCAAYHKAMHRAVVLSLLLACHAQPVVDYTRPDPPQPHASPHQAHYDPNAALTTEAVAGRWRYGKSQPAEEGLAVDSLGHGATLNLRGDGSYTQITLTETHPQNCKLSIVDWEQGSWTRTGNAIDLQPTSAFTQVIDRCNSSNNGRRPKQLDASRYTVEVGKDRNGDWLVLYLPNGRRHSGPYYREPDAGG